MALGEVGGPGVGGRVVGPLLRVGPLHCALLLVLLVLLLAPSALHPQVGRLLLIGAVHLAGGDPGLSPVVVDDGEVLLLADLHAGALPQTAGELVVVDGLDVGGALGLGRAGDAGPGPDLRHALLLLAFGRGRGGCHGVAVDHLGAGLLRGAAGGVVADLDGGLLVGSLVGPGAAVVDPADGLGGVLRGGLQVHLPLHLEVVGVPRHRGALAADGRGLDGALGEVALDLQVVGVLDDLGPLADADGCGALTAGKVTLDLEVVGVPDDGGALALDGHVLLLAGELAADAEVILVPDDAGPLADEGRVAADSALKAALGHLEVVRVAYNFSSFTASTLEVLLGLFWKQD